MEGGEGGKKNLKKRERSGVNWRNLEEWKRVARVSRRVEECTEGGE